jgi:ribonuclease P/MRP protein subunit POP5
LSEEFYMGEPKKLPPSLRMQKRYIVFEVISESPIEYGNLLTAIWESCLNFLGEILLSKAEIWIIQNLYNEKIQKGIIRCSHEFVEEIRSALSLIYMIGETKAIVKILGVTGTINSAEVKYLQTK